MLCNLFEDARIKCDQYWPDEVGKKIIYGNFIEIELLSEEKILEGLIIERKFAIEPFNKEDDLQKDPEKIGNKIDNFNFNNISREKHYITQLHVICWPDHSVPNKKDYFRLFDYLVKIIHNNYQSSIENCIKHSPVIVHCSAGVGRTGTLISIYNLFDHLNRQLNAIKNTKYFLSKIKEGKNINIKLNIQNYDAYENNQQLSSEEDLNQINSKKTCQCQMSYIENENQTIFFSVFSLVRKLREQRFLFVTDLCQYKIIYKFAYNWIRYYFFDKKEFLKNELIDDQIESPTIISKSKPFINKGGIILNATSDNSISCYINNDLKNNDEMFKIKVKNQKSNSYKLNNEEDFECNILNVNYPQNYLPITTKKNNNNNLNTNNYNKLKYDFQLNSYNQIIDDDKEIDEVHKFEHKIGDEGLEINFNSKLELKNQKPCQKIFSDIKNEENLELELENNNNDDEKKK